MSSPNVRDENGDSYIPASQRPDGTWRKARRVKEGYVPQEEVPLYESKGKQFLNRQVRPADPLPSGITAHRSIPGLFIQEEKDKEKTKVKKKQSKKVEEITKHLEQTKLIEPSKPKLKSEAPKTEINAQEAAIDPTKKLKNLKKRLREVEVLEEKLKKGEISKPDPDQIKKIHRKPDLLMQIRELEKKL